jgi:hypothetical protein
MIGKDAIGAERGCELIEEAKMRRALLGVFGVAVLGLCLHYSANAVLGAAPPSARDRQEVEAVLAPDLLLWLDASDRATLTVGRDGHVLAWASKAAKVGRTLTSSGAQQPLYVASRPGRGRQSSWSRRDPTPETRSSTRWWRRIARAKTTSSPA